MNGVEGLKDADEAEKTQLRKRFGINEGEKVVSIVARLEDIKGHKYFVEAADEILKSGINAKFFIAGTGSYENEIKAQIERLGLEDKVIMTGFISDVDKLMSITDVQANASYGTEATSLALLEGMSIGIPAVVSDFGGNPGVIKDGVNGFVVPKKNSEQLAAALKKLLSDDALYKKLSDGSREIFKETFTAAAMTRNTENLYTAVLNGKEVYGYGKG